MTHRCCLPPLLLQGFLSSLCLLCLHLASSSPPLPLSLAPFASERYLTQDLTSQAWMVSMIVSRRLIDETESVSTKRIDRRKTSDLQMRSMGAVETLALQSLISLMMKRGMKTQGPKWCCQSEHNQLGVRHCLAYTCTISTKH